MNGIFRVPRAEITVTVSPSRTSLAPHINTSQHMHILHNVVHEFSIVLTGRICLTIRSFLIISFIFMTFRCDSAVTMRRTKVPVTLMGFNGQGGVN